MKKKIKKKRLYQQWLFWLMIIVISAVVLTFVNWSSEPHFKIYKEECRNENETYIIYPRDCESFDFEIKSFNILDKGLNEQVLESYLCYEEVKDIENETDKILVRSVGGNNYNETREVYCDYRLSHFEEGQRIDSYRNYTVFEYKPENFDGLFLEDLINVDNDTICNNNKFHGVYVEIIGYGKFCEPVEVDEIIPTIEVCGYITMDGDKLNSVDCKIKECSPIPKQDLSIEWLDENCNKKYDCGILSIEIEEGSEIKKIGLDKSDCEFKYYKCGENYIVEGIR